VFSIVTVESSTRIENESAFTRFRLEDGQRLIGQRHLMRAAVLAPLARKRPDPGRIEVYDWKYVLGLSRDVGRLRAFRAAVLQERLRG
jgi:hypothetical protein